MSNLVAYFPFLASRYDTIYTHVLLHRSLLPDISTDRHFKRNDQTASQDPIRENPTESIHRSIKSCYNHPPPNTTQENHVDPYRLQEASGFPCQIPDNVTLPLRKNSNMFSEELG
jgi:hypothetical protein